jgi:hypothetical protein
MYYAGDNLVHCGRTLLDAARLKRAFDPFFRELHVLLLLNLAIYLAVLHLKFHFEQRASRRTACHEATEINRN